ncbi:SDR family oxidoreductase [Effusibacillus dendaii]|uniref:Short-chain dehydrogenase n=1 Tax=Effusibacillus dendaii TaxID=2743772 RepID=A0A7I8D4N9_9BACL|nr:SDR family oxidoreductase [Effusibacillus dendaii]BCJ85027.1 short-chain dehydrogenase [Effusibacillus dendaii]
MFDLNSIRGKTIAITGASRGIGKETAQLLGSLGANLVLGSRNVPDLTKVSSQIQAKDASVLAVQLDVTNESSVRHFLDASISQFGAVDALINSAGVGTFASIIDLSSDDFENMLAVNLKGTFLCCKYFGQHMAARRKGQILNMVSIAGTTALPGCGGYSASKFGVLGFTRVLQTELRDKGVRVTSVLPGAVDSPFWEKISQKPDTADMIPLQVMARHIVYLLTQPDGAVVDEITIMPPFGIL